MKTALTCQLFSNAVIGPVVKVGFICPCTLIQVLPPLTESCHWIVGVVMFAAAVNVKVFPE